MNIQFDAKNKKLKKPRFSSIWPIRLFRTFDGGVLPFCGESVFLAAPADWAIYI